MKKYIFSLLILICISLLNYCTRGVNPLDPENTSNSSLTGTNTINGTVTLESSPFSNAIIIIDTVDNSTGTEHDFSKYLYKTNTDVNGYYSIKIPNNITTLYLNAYKDYNSDGMRSGGDLICGKLNAYTIINGINQIDLALRYVLTYQYHVIYSNAQDPFTYRIRTMRTENPSDAIQFSGNSGSGGGYPIYDSIITGYCGSRYTSFDAQITAYQDMNGDRNYNPGEPWGTNNTVTATWVQGDPVASTVNYDTVLIQYTN